MSCPQLRPYLTIADDFVEHMLSIAHSIVLFVHPTARIISFNHQMYELCGYRQREVAGLDWFDQFVPESEHAHLREQFDHALARDEIETLVCPLVTRSGDVRLLEWGLHRVHDRHGELLGLVGVGHDITEKPMLRAKLAETDPTAN